jgi:hypothetical protein
MIDGIDIIFLCLWALRRFGHEPGQAPSFIAFQRTVSLERAKTVGWQLQF